MLRIRELREDNDYTQAEIAKLLDCTQQTYSRYELEEIIINAIQVKKLAKFYNTSADYILGLTDVIEPYPRSKKR